MAVPLRPTDVLQVLRDARDLLAQGWTQGTSARNIDGEPVGVSSLDAVSFCASGACRRVDSLFGGVAVLELAQTIAPLTYSGESIVIHWNDQPGMTKEKVLLGFDHAITQYKAVHGV